jgi:hypothetical protein
MSMAFAVGSGAAALGIIPGYGLYLSNIHAQLLKSSDGEAMVLVAKRRKSFGPPQSIIAFGGAEVPMNSFATSYGRCEGDCAAR